jgi:hypothetical protein
MKDSLLSDMLHASIIKNELKGDKSPKNSARDSRESASQQKHAI